MNTRELTVLTALAGTLALAEFGSAVIIGLGKDPWGSSFAVLFGGFFLLATWLLRSGRVGAGAIFAGILCLFEVIEFLSSSSPAGTSTTCWTGCTRAPLP